MSTKITQAVRHKVNNLIKETYFFSQFKKLALLCLIKAVLWRQRFAVDFVGGLAGRLQVV